VWISSGAWQLTSARLSWWWLGIACFVGNDAVYLVHTKSHGVTSLKSNLGLGGFISSRLFASCHLGSVVDCCAPMLGEGGLRPEVPRLGCWSWSGAWREWRTRWQDPEVLEILFLFAACVCDQELKRFYPGTDESAFDSIVITICKKPNFPDVLTHSLLSP
jgi:hypothetical protein